MLCQQSTSTILNVSRLQLAAASSFVTTSSTSSSSSSSSSSTTTSGTATSTPARSSSIEDHSYHHHHHHHHHPAVYQRQQRRNLVTMATPAKSKGQEEKARPSQPRWNYFPLGYKDAAYQWWSTTKTSAERSVFNHIPYIKEVSDLATTEAVDDTQSDPFGPRVWRSQMVKLSGKNRELNEFSVERVGEEVEDNLVMLHGYGAGLGFFYKNFEPLSRKAGWKLYALDMLGMGNSSRPPFTVHAKEREGKIDEAEAWFVDALEEWRKARNIEKFTLIGHSLGGYMSVAYALKYPGRLKKLILASPVGVPHDPYAVNEAMPEPESSTLINEFTQDGESVVNDSRNKANAAVKQPANTAANNSPKRPLPGWFVWLWDCNVSPFSIVRWGGPLGPRFVSGWSSRRFNHLPEEEAKSLHDYAFSIFRQRGSGEYALTHILAPGAYARRPVITRIADVGRQTMEKNGELVRETGIPVVMMYGENDWMDPAGGLASEEKMREAKLKAALQHTAEEKQRENGSSKTIIIQKAGHHLYLDNPEDFNNAIFEEMDHTRAQSRQGLV